MNFRPRGKGKRMPEILHQGKDISRSGFVTEPGQQIEDITIVVGSS